MKMFRQTSMIAAIAAIMLMGLSAVSAQDTIVNTTSTMNTITVTGLGTASGEPDVAYVELGVETVNADLSTAFNDANTSMNAVIATLTAQGIERVDIQTTLLNVYQEDLYDQSRGAPTGERVYHVQNFVRVTVRDTAQVGVLVSAAVEAGANRINGLSFGILQMDTLEASARAAAVENARDRATQLAQSLGVEVGAAIAVREVYYNSPVMPLARAGGGLQQDSISAAPVSGGSLQVTVQIEVTFALVSE